MEDLAQSEKVLEDSLWNAVFDSLAGVPYSAKLQQAILGEILKSTVEKNKLSVCLKLKEISFGDVTLSLMEKPFLLRLFYLFASTPLLELTKKDLIENLYHIPVDTESMSVRRFASLSHNVVKLVSRGRILAKENFTDQNRNYSLEWFPYSSETQSWSLYRVKLT